MICTVAIEVGNEYTYNIEYTISVVFANIGVVFTSVPQRNDLVKYVCSQIATKCYLVGEYLGLDKEVLDQIKDNKQGKDLEASYEIIMHWLFESPEPTWKNLLTVLASDEVGEYTLAQLLNEKFVCATK